MCDMDVENEVGAVQWAKTSWDKNGYWKTKGVSVDMLWEVSHAEVAVANLGGVLCCTGD